jgi:hypothetical protein
MLAAGRCPQKRWRYIFDNGPDIWIVCQKHKVKWYVGSGLFSAWRDCTSEELLRGRYILSTFHEVERVNDYRSTAEYMTNKRLGRDPLTLPSDDDDIVKVHPDERFEGFF